MDSPGSASSAEIPISATIARMREDMKRKALYADSQENVLHSSNSSPRRAASEHSVREGQDVTPLPKSGTIMRLGIKSPIKPSSDIGEALPVVKRLRSTAQNDPRTLESAARVQLLSSAQAVRDAWDDDWVAVAAPRPQSPTGDLTLPVRAPSTRWTDEETQLLLDGMSHYLRPHGNWKNISVNFLHGKKSNTQCKDKFVNLVKANRLGRRSDGTYFLLD